MLANARVGVIHSQFGFSDGVSIVMEQVDHSLKKLGVNLFYLVGRSSFSAPNISVNPLLWHLNPVNQSFLSSFSSEPSRSLVDSFESVVNKASKVVESWVFDNGLDFLIVHNSSHPVNFVLSLAVARFFRNARSSHLKVPKYVLWWHDSHLERPRFSNPSRTVKNYLLEGVPGPHPDGIVFINSLQWGLVKDYFFELGGSSLVSFFEERFVVIPNTTSPLISCFNDLLRLDNSPFINGLPLFHHQQINPADFLLVLQHTRVVPRKQILFALDFSFALADRLRDLKNGLLFIISGGSGDEGSDYKHKILSRFRELQSSYSFPSFIVFLEDFPSFPVSFERVPLHVASLGGLATFFSSIEGFGNNLLETLSAGLPTVVYEYPVLVSDILPSGLILPSVKEFRVSDELLFEASRLLSDDFYRKKVVEHNLEVLRSSFPHSLISERFSELVKKIS